MRKFRRKKRGPVVSKKITVDGIKFASGLEAYMYKALKAAKIKADYEKRTFEIFKGFDFTNPDACQYIQDTIIEAKNQAKKSNSLFVFDPVRMKMFNGFFFMMNRNIIKYEHSDTELFEPKYIMTKNEDEFNWGKLIPNNDFAALCKTSFIFHYKGVSTFEVFDNYGEISNDVSEWKKQRKLKGG